MSGIDARFLVRRALAGDAEASRALYRLHVGPVFRVVRPWCASEADAEDVVQETFARAFAALGRYEARPGATFLGWLLTIALNHARSRTRRARAAPAADDSREPGTTAEDELARAERRTALLAALETLEERERAVVSLRYGAELPAAEVAAMLDLTEANVRKIGERARKRLLEALRPALGSER